MDVPAESIGGVMKSLAERKARIDDMKTNTHGATIVATVPTRGLIGFEFDLMNLTSGHGIHSHLFKEYAPHAGPMTTRSTGTLVSTEAGEATSYALDTIQVRGKLFVGPGEHVYDGMIIGENPRTDDLPVNPCRAKQLTNFRSCRRRQGHPAHPADPLHPGTRHRIHRPRRTRRGHAQEHPPAQTHAGLQPAREGEEAPRGRAGSGGSRERNSG